MSRTDSFSTRNSRLIQPNEGVTHIAVIQRFGMTGRAESNPTLSQGFSSEGKALEWVKRYVQDVHGETPIVQRVYQELGASDGEDLSDPNAHTKCLIFVRCVSGPTWGVVLSS